MDEPTKRGRLIRFSVFELDLDSGELFKQGRKVKLQGQPFELLVALLERPGEVVTREDLQQKIWPSDTVVDFDPGLNRAINKVREALGDSAESPHFIETLPRRGYRFIGSIQEPSVPDAPPIEAAPLAPATFPPQAERQSKPRARWVESRWVWQPPRAWWRHGQRYAFRMGAGKYACSSLLRIPWRTRFGTL